MRSRFQGLLVPLTLAVLCIAMFRCERQVASQPPFSPPHLLTPYPSAAP